MSVPLWSVDLNDTRLVGYTFYVSTRDIESQNALLFNGPTVTYALSSIISVKVDWKY